MGSGVVLSINGGWRTRNDGQRWDKTHFAELSFYGPSCKRHYYAFLWTIRFRSQLKQWARWSACLCLHVCVSDSWNSTSHFSAKSWSSTWQKLYDFHWNYSKLNLRTTFFPPAICKARGVAYYSKLSYWKMMVIYFFINHPLKFTNSINLNSDSHL